MRSWFMLPFSLMMALFIGCSATFKWYVDEEALTAQLPVKNSQTLDIPVHFFDEILPQRYQYKGLGIINDQETFAKLWQIYSKDNTTVPPSFDFRDYALLFAYDPNYDNPVAIIGLNVWQGVANPVIQKGVSKLKIGGNPQMRKIREAEGQKLPAPKVQVAFLQIRRHRPGTPGVTSILVEGDLENPGDSRVIPVPSEP